MVDTSEHGLWAGSRLQTVRRALYVWRHPADPLARRCTGSGASQPPQALAAPTSPLPRSSPAAVWQPHRTLSPDESWHLEAEAVECGRRAGLQPLNPATGAVSLPQCTQTPPIPCRCRRANALTVVAADGCVAPESHARHPSAGHEEATRSAALCREAPLVMTWLPQMRCCTHRARAPAGQRTF